MIRKAKLLEIPEILEVTRACAQHMIANGIFQWNEHYPSRTAFENDINRDESYVLEDDKKIIAGIVVFKHI